MARPKISLLAAGAVMVVLAAACGGTAANAATATEATPTASPTAIALASPSSTPVASTSATVSPTAAPTPELFAGTVVEVVDGDTIHVQLPSGVEKVRIIGIDTPETVDPNRPASCFGPEATAFAKETLAGKPVTLELDPTQDRRDRFDRLLAHVHVGDALYAAEAIAGGYGIHYIYEVPSIHAAELAAAEASAKAANLGIWASCEGRVDLPLSAVPEPTPLPVVAASAPPAGSNCHPSYTPCVPNAGHDLDCKDIGFMVTIIGPDEYRLDGSDHDGKGCESYR